MGLDQSFYIEKDWDADEVAYFRKFHDLHKKIEDIKGKPVDNGEFVELRRSELDQIVKYLKSEESDYYWAKYGDEDNYILYRDSDSLLRYEKEPRRVSESYKSAIGALIFYDILYYNGDW